MARQHMSACWYPNRDFKEAHRVFVLKASAQLGEIGVFYGLHTAFLKEHLKYIIQGTD